MKQCKICGSCDWEIVYQGPIRMGKLYHLSVEQHTISRCKKCMVQCLDNEESINVEYYKSELYRYEIGENCNIKDYERRHDSEVKYQLDLYPLQFFRDILVADIGCGGGIFLDAIYGFAQKTIGIEPNDVLREQLTKKGHECFSSVEEYTKTGEKVDIAVSFNVIEHVDEPLEFIRSMKSIVKHNGKLIFTTPNADDFLVHHGPVEYKAHFYRKVHGWYFCKESLETLMKLAGFENFKITFQHSYGLSNTIAWMRGKGIGRVDFLEDEMLDVSWKHFLISKGQSERLVCTGVC
jgi:2-polyprenyl-3-methyl-5-hydroxy-6-metoxy-1,4-benzoquinol methylase